MKHVKVLQNFVKVKARDFWRRAGPKFGHAWACLGNIGQERLKSVYNAIYRYICQNNTVFDATGPCLTTLSSYRPTAQLEKKIKIF